MFLAGTTIANINGGAASTVFFFGTLIKRSFCFFGAGREQIQKLV